MLFMMDCMYWGQGAEAALGPAAKNIDGHRVGVIRILDSITRKSEKLK